MQAPAFAAEGTSIASGAESPLGKVGYARRTALNCQYLRCMSPPWAQVANPKCSSSQSSFPLAMCGGAVSSQSLLMVSVV